MNRQELETQLRVLIDEAERELDDPANAIDLRAYRAPYDSWDDLAIFCAYPPDFDDVWNFVKNADEWFVDIYENFIGENCAEYTGKTVWSK